MSLFDRLGDALEGRGQTILYALGGLVVAALLIIFFVKWSARKNDEARQALGRAINIATATVSSTPVSNPSDNTFSSEQARSQRAIQEFEKVAAKYGDPYKTEARYFIATNQLTLDRQKGMTELAELGNSNNIPEVAALSKFALAQAKESGGKLDEAAQLYGALVKLNNPTAPPER